MQAEPSPDRPGRAVSPAGDDVHGNPPCIPRPGRRCFETCPEVLREADQANRLRALVARLLERLPTDDPLVEEARRCLE